MGGELLAAHGHAQYACTIVCPVLPCTATFFCKSGMLAPICLVLVLTEVVMAVNFARVGSMCSSCNSELLLLPLVLPAVDCCCSFLQVNSSPYEDGWMIKVKLSNTKQLPMLLVVLLLVPAGEQLSLRGRLDDQGQAEQLRRAGRPAELVSIRGTLPALKQQQKRPGSRSSSSRGSTGSLGCSCV
jgi:hypothetical protein